MFILHPKPHNEVNSTESSCFFLYTPSNPPSPILTDIYTIEVHLYKEASTCYQLCIRSVSYPTRLWIHRHSPHKHISQGYSLCYASGAVYLFGHWLFIDFRGLGESAPDVPTREHRVNQASSTGPWVHSPAVVLGPMNNTHTPPRPLISLQGDT